MYTALQSVSCVVHWLAHVFFWSNHLHNSAAEDGTYVLYANKQPHQLSRFKLAKPRGKGDRSYSLRGTSGSASASS